MGDELTSDLVDLSADVLEALKDEVIQDSVLRELPVFGWFAKSIRIVGDIKDKIFMNKIARFLSAKTDVSAEDHENFRGRISSDTRYRKKVGEALLLLLDRFNDFDKAEILAYIFAAHQRSEISLDEFRLLGEAVDLAYVGDLYVILHQHPGQSLDWGGDSAASRLIRSGLTKLSFTKENPALSYRLRTPRSQQSNELERLGFDRDFYVDGEITLSELGETFLHIMGKVNWKPT